MTNLADKISTVVLVVMENRSFDHMLGHLKYEGFMPDVDGLDQNLAQYQNLYQGNVFTPFAVQEDHQLVSDVPHEFDYVATQLAASAVTGNFAMNGFVEAYAKFTNTHPAQEPDPMAFFKSGKVPITNFLARNFAVCDRWHAPLPTSTQPNRTMAFCGSSHIFDTSSGPRLITTDDVLFDWLDAAKVRWRVYHDGLSFFALYTSAWKHLFQDKFRDFEYYFHDMQMEPLDSGPQLIIVEPSYNDAPHIGPDHPNDNHPPLAIGWGEDFLRRVYQAATVNPIRWSKTMLIHYYDEHGGFFDHVPPPRIGTRPMAIRRTSSRASAYVSPESSLRRMSNRDQFATICSITLRCCSCWRRFLRRANLTPCRSTSAGSWVLTASRVYSKTSPEPMFPRCPPSRFEWRAISGRGSGYVPKIACNLRSSWP